MMRTIVLWLMVFATVAITAPQAAADEDESDYSTPSVSGHPCYLVVQTGQFDPVEVWYETNGIPGLQRGRDTPAHSASASQNCAVRDVVFVKNQMTGDFQLPI